MSEAKTCGHCGAGPDEPCPVGCTCGRDGDVSEANHCRSGVYCLLHDCACPCDGCLPHSDPEAHENKTLRADVARLTRERDEARAAYASASREWAERHEHARERIAGLTRERDEAQVKACDACCRERDEAVAAAVEQRERYHALCGKFHEMANSESNRALRAKVAELTGERDAARRELHRLTHGEDIEGDGVCRHEIDAQAARAWSRLWHREARRLWREVQALGAMLDDVQREVDAEQWVRDVGGEPTRATVFTHLPGGGVCRCLHDDGPVCADCPRVGGGK